MPRLSATQLASRRTHILDAAERCFAHEGFHRTTIQDICRESAVSPGALYLYFASKEALIAGICERDRADLAADFAEVEQAPDFMAAFAALGHKHLVEAPREKAAMCLAIWSEAVRNPVVAEICLAFDDALKGHLRNLFESARRRGHVAEGVDLDALATLFLTIADGLFKRRAVEAGFEGAKAMTLALAVLQAGFAGALPLSGPEPVR